MKKLSTFKMFGYLSFLLLILCFFPGSLKAETRYVSGIIVVNIRDSFKNQARIIGTVKSGDQVEILEESNHFSRVKTKDNIMGWVPSNYLHTEAPTTESILKLKEELNDLKKKNEQLAVNQSKSIPDSGLQDDQKKKLNQTLDALKTDNTRLLEENQKLLRLIKENEQALQILKSENSEAEVLKEKAASLQKKYDELINNSRDIIKITNERDSLAKEVATLEAESAGIQKLNQKLESDKVFSWFFAGAAVFFVGLLSSKIFTRRKSKLSF